MKTSKRHIYKILAITFIISIIFVSFKMYNFYKVIYGENVELTDNVKFIYFNIPSNATFDDVRELLRTKKILKNIENFSWLAVKKEYNNNVKAGRYKIDNGMSNHELINLLRSGNQSPVKVSFNNIRTLNQLAHVISLQIEADSLSLIKAFENIELLNELSLTNEQLRGIFIPNTYEMYWNTDAIKFVKRMYKEYNIFWNSNREKLLTKIGYSKHEVITIASIINEESNYSPEFSTIAGVYINRLKRGMPLQADPSIKFALNDFLIKRVLKKHLEFKSPYNTYINVGLPPGPIALPSIKAIDAVLNYKQHSYLYFCASSDFSGKHVFAKTLSQHNVNAIKYQKVLNKNKIFK